MSTKVAWGEVAVLAADAQSVANNVVASQVSGADIASVANSAAAITQALVSTY
jgi:hypothetical protein